VKLLRADWYVATDISKSLRDFQCKTFNEGGIRERVKERRIPNRGHRKGECKCLKILNP
jgi:hypothetical protein